MFRFFNFWKRNSTFILWVLGFLFLMEYCSRVMMPAPKQKVVNPVVEVQPKAEGGGKRIKNYEEILMERRAKQQTNWPLLAWLAAGATVLVAGYYAHRKGWLRGLVPGSVSFSSALMRDRSTGRLLMRLLMSNTTQGSQTFLLPHLLFKHGGEVRRFKIKSEDFPLTLTQGTSHSLVIDVDQFWEKVPDLVRFNSIGAEIDTTSGKVFKTRILPKWWVFKRI
jgi:hypothetical protein